MRIKGGLSPYLLRKEEAKYFMSRKPYYEPEYEEEVEHDTVMVMIDGKLVEVTSDDPEAQQ